MAAIARTRSGTAVLRGIRDLTTHFMLRGSEFKPRKCAKLVYPESVSVEAMHANDCNLSLLWGYGAMPCLRIREHAWGASLSTQRRAHSHIRL